MITIKASKCNSLFKYTLDKKQVHGCFKRLGIDDFLLCRLNISADPKKYSYLIKSKMHNKEEIFKIEIFYIASKLT